MIINIKGGNKYMTSIDKVSDGVLLAKESQSYFDKETIIRGGLRGEVLAGYDLHIDPKTGLSELGETIVRKKNEIVLGGSLFALEKLFGVSSSVNVEYLNNIMGIGLDGPQITDKYPKETCVCLFNVGIGGAGSAYTDVKGVLQQIRQIDGMIPFRIVDEKFQEGTKEYDQYWFAKQTEDGKYAYYLKTFLKKPVIRALWKDSGDGEDGSPVVESDYASTRSTPIEAFAEAVLQIEKTDLREYFELYDNIERARLNTIGLCTGIKSTLADGSEEFKQVLQFSSLNFSNEMLHMNKDLSIIYRVYTA